MSATTAPVQAATGSDAEFAEAKEIRRLFGIEKTLAYRLEKLGCIESVSLRQKGKKRGKRLYVVHTVRDYLNSLRKPQATPADRTERI